MQKVFRGSAAVAASFNKSIKFASKMRWLGLGDTARLAPYFERYV